MENSEIQFKKWLEMTSCASCGGGMTGTGDIAKFSLPIGLKRRNVKKEEDPIAKASKK